MNHDLGIKQTEKEDKSTEQKYIWIDLEMTGLDPKTDKILEIVSVVTDGDLNIIAQGPEIVISHPESRLLKMDPWCTRVHKKTGLWDRVIASDTSLEEAEQQTLSFLRQHLPLFKKPWLFLIIKKLKAKFILLLIHYIKSYLKTSLR